MTKGLELVIFFFLILQHHSQPVFTLCLLLLRMNEYIIFSKQTIRNILKIPLHISNKFIYLNQTENSKKEIESYKNY